MKKSVLICAAVILAVASMGAFLETARTTRAFIRSAAGTSDVTLADLTWDARSSSTYKMSRKANSLVFHFTGSADGITCSDTEIWGYTRACTARLLWVGSVTAGTLETDDSTFLADTITTTTDNTRLGVTILDGGGANRHATLAFDPADCEYVYATFPSIASGTLNCYVTSY